MAIVWMKQSGATRYEVRSAGNSVRLYTNGVFHSQYNPSSPVTGSVWDLLMLPAFLHDPASIKRVLVLGVGGGAVTRQLDHFLDAEKIVGVELDPVHLHVARKYFGNDRHNIELVEADAVDWVKHYRGPKFDMIIDDIFGEEAGEPLKAVEADASWFATLLRVLTAKGVLVSNFVSPIELRRCAYLSDERVRARFSSAFQLTTPLYENAVGVFCRREADSKQLRKNLAAFRELDTRKKGCRLRYTIRRIGA